jgi:hypothetical protein
VVLVGIFVLAPLARVHPDALVDPTVAANTAMDMCSIRAVHQILASGSRQRGLSRGRPVLIGFGWAPDLIRS